MTQSPGGLVAAHDRRKPRSTPNVAAERTRTVASWLGRHTPDDLVSGVRAVARRKPGMFLTGAVITGVLAGRLTRNVGASRPESATPGPATARTSGPGDSNGVAPSPPPERPTYSNEPGGLPSDPPMPG
jgi:hypothetical protein